MRIHFIAIGGAAMHSLAIALTQKGHEVTGSDDEVFDPAKAQFLNFFIGRRQKKPGLSLPAVTVKPPLRQWLCMC